MNTHKQKIVILDTSAFIAGFNPYEVKGEVFSVPAVREELKKNYFIKNRFDLAVESGKLKVIKPKFFYINLIKASSKESGDLRFLSKTDLHVLALALELNENSFSTEILTDDYSIQNVAKKNNLKYASFTTFGIKKIFNWVLYCPGCKKRYPSDYTNNLCDVCGTIIKRKPKK
jgi:UPF0271 protein